MAASTTKRSSSTAGPPDTLSLHLPRRVDDLRRPMADQIARIAPGASAAVLFAEADNGTRTVKLTVGDGCPLTVGSVVAPDAWSSPRMRTFPLRYPGYELGELLIDAELDSHATAALDHLVAHYTVALVNLELNSDLENAKEHYGGILNAMQDGIGLFQERDREVIGARFLYQVVSALGTQRGALWILEEPGVAGSPLHLDQALGVPEGVLAQLTLPSGEWWPPVALAQPRQALSRGAGGAFPVLDDDCLPAVLESIVTCPLRYHGMTVGVALAFNADTSSAAFAGKLDSIEHLGELGAAIFHRMQLEAAAVRNHGIETQLAIASRIQSHLQPKALPDSAALDCAWSSRAAQSIGGDYLDILTDASGGLHAVIADVSGHGIDSALLMMSMRATYRAECSRRELDDLLGKLNDEIANEAGDTGMFVTAAACRIDHDGQKLRYASAGHNALFVYRAGTGTVEELDSTGPSLGFFAGADYDAVELEMHAGDVLLLYTDGVVEAARPGQTDAMFGDDRLKAVLHARSSRPAREILDAVLDELRAFTGSDRFDDDVSVSVIVFAPDAEPRGNRLTAATRD